LKEWKEAQNSEYAFTGSGMERMEEKRVSCSCSHYKTKYKRIERVFRSSRWDIASRLCLSLHP